MQAQTVLSAALVSLLAAGALGAASNAHATDKMAGHASMEKCYGVNAAMKNDCQSPGHSCAGQDSKARDPQAFVAVPAPVRQARWWLAAIRRRRARRDDEKELIHAFITPFACAADPDCGRDRAAAAACSPGRIIFHPTPQRILPRMPSSSSLLW